MHQLQKCAVYQGVSGVDQYSGVYREGEKRGYESGLSGDQRILCPSGGMRAGMPTGKPV